MLIKKILVGLAILISLYGNATKISADNPIIIKPKLQEDYIKEIFGDKAKIATAVLMHESSMKLNAINYNCRYNGKSKSCKRGDEKLAWSVDCGIAQVNVKGRVCPKHLFTLEGNMKAVEKIYKTQGLKAWVSYTTGRYKKFM
jgi:hypothetical protein